MNVAKPKCKAHHNKAARYIASGFCYFFGFRLVADLMQLGTFLPFFVFIPATL
jgi:hypothetical protein